VSKAALVAEFIVLCGGAPLVKRLFERSRLAGSIAIVFFGVLLASSIKVAYGDFIEAWALYPKTTLLCALLVGAVAWLAPTLTSKLPANRVFLASAAIGLASLLVPTIGFLLTQGHNQPEALVMTTRYPKIQYFYDGIWGLLDIASSARALSDQGTVVAKARVTSNPPDNLSLPLTGIDVEELVYSADEKSVVDVGNVRFAIHGRVVSFTSKSGRMSPVFDKWYLGRR
jgi:hypothetical protein